MALLREPVADPGLFEAGEVVGAAEFFDRWGFVVVRGLLSEPDVDTLAAECATAQARLVAGELAERYGTTELVDDPSGTRTVRFANYVTHVDELCPAVAAAARHPASLDLLTRWLGRPWLGDGRHGVVYQDARPGAESSYSRIGWHSDWQSAPHRAIWPSVAFTIHIDATSPANGFLRVVPGSHRWATPAPYHNVNNAAVPEGSSPWGGHTEEPPPFAMPLGFEKVPGEVAVYAERGDVIFHDCYLWHSAARATADGSVRRHVRGSWFGGAEDRSDDGVFVKNAAR